MPKNLSRDTLTNIERTRISGDIKEERERQWWKTRLLWAAAIAILIFYGIFLWFVIIVIPHCSIDHNHVFMAAVLAAVPTLLAINFLKLVRSRNSSEKDIENSPWFSLIRELIEAIKGK